MTRDEGERGEAREGGRDGGDAPFSKAIQPDHAKERGEEEEGSKKRETRRKARARGVGGGGGRV